MTRRIFIWYASQFADLLAPLARELRDRHGIESVLFCYRLADLPDRSRYDFDPAAFAEIVDCEALLWPRPLAALPDAATQAAAAAELDRRMSMSIVDILRCDRHLGIAFVTGAVFYRSHYGGALDWRQKIDLVLRLAARFETLFDAHRPVAMLATPGDVGPATLIALGEAREIPLQGIIRARTGKRFYLTRDRHCWPWGLEAAFAATLARTSPDAAPEPVEPPQAAKIYLAGLAERTQLRFLARQILAACRREAGRRLKRAAIINREYLFADRIWIAWRVWRHRRRIVREPAVLPSLPEGQPYVFFPLAVEPESSLMVESQMCDSQLQAIDWLAKTLPGGWLLLVKEHPAATAPRPRGFFERIAAYPNVRLLAALEPGERIAFGARAVATINGSLGVQAAAQGVPIVTFHPRYVGGLLPHAFVVRDYEATRAALSAIRDGRLPPLAERQRAAHALMAALDELSHPLEDPHLLRGRAGGARVAGAQIELIARVYAGALEPPPRAPTQTAKEHA